MARIQKKVLLAMSGGVDSSVAASLLLDAGWDVTGVFLDFGIGSPGVEDARRVARVLGIELFVLDCRDALAGVIEHFLDEYARGRTPNPCILCNARVKFARLIARADAMGIRWVATGHHARVIDADSQPAVARARSPGKDQSYALFAVSREHLSRILLPIGELGEKARVRELARGLGLDVHDKPDSQEICFVPDDDYVSLLRARRPGALKAGEIVNAAGEVLGTHEGFATYTIGQRRGLGVAAGAPMYVTHIDPQTARVTIGPREELLSRRLRASGTNWHFEPPKGTFEATVQIRYNHAGAAARVRTTGERTFEVEFAQPVHAITPGQAAVVYFGQRLIGGGWIE